MCAIFSVAPYDFFRFVLFCVVLCFFFFFFKQKTAYDMRISYWSSDVCSSDLAGTSPSHLRCWSERLRGAMVTAPRPPAITSEVRHYRRSRPTGHGAEPWQACPRRRAPHRPRDLADHPATGRRGERDRPRSDWVGNDLLPSQSASSLINGLLDCID